MNEYSDYETDVEFYERVAAISTTTTTTKNRLKDQNDNFLRNQTRSWIINLTNQCTKSVKFSSSNCSQHSSVNIDLKKHQNNDSGKMETRLSSHKKKSSKKTLHKTEMIDETKQIIQRKYLEYKNLSQFERDNSKTSYTNDLSMEHDWRIPNLCRRGLRAPRNHPADNVSTRFHNLSIYNKVSIISVVKSFWAMAIERVHSELNRPMPSSLVSKSKKYGVFAILIPLLMWAMFSCDSFSIPRLSFRSPYADLENEIAQKETKFLNCCQGNSTEEIIKIFNDMFISMKKDIVQQVIDEMTKRQSLVVNQCSVSTEMSQKLDQEHIERIVQSAINKYDADKTGEADYALDPSGAYIISTRCTKTYDLNSASYKMFGLTLWRSSNSPRVVIQPNVIPGDCWCFEGGQGRIAIHLSATITPTAVSYEHIPKSLARDGTIVSAPNNFLFFGLKSETDIEPELLGNFSYSIDEGKEPLQRFEIQNVALAKKKWQIVEMAVQSNHGHPNYTCLYRVRVHGTV